MNNSIVLDLGDISKEVKLWAAVCQQRIGGLECIKGLGGISVRLSQGREGISNGPSILLSTGKLSDEHLHSLLATEIQ